MGILYREWENVKRALALSGFSPAPRSADRASPTPPTCTANFRIGPTIRLLGYDLEQRQGAEGAALELTLQWRADGAPEADYVVYVHLVDAEGRLLGQHDSLPRDGQYPTTWWLPNQVVLDRHTILLSDSPTGVVRLRVGMYDPVTLVRAPAYDNTGRRLPEDTIPLTEITLEGEK